MGNGWNIITPPNTVRLRSTGPNPHRLDSSRLPDPEPAGVGKAHWVGDTSPHKPPKERRGERERDPHHELAIQFMVCSAQDVPRKEGGVLAIFCLGLFRPVCRPHVHFLPLKGGKCRPFLFWGLFRAVCRPHVHFLPSKEGGVLAFFGGGSFSARLSTACALSTPKRGEVPAIFVLGSFSGRLSTARFTFNPETAQNARQFFVWSFWSPFRSKIDL